VTTTAATQQPSVLNLSAKASALRTLNKAQRFLETCPEAEVAQARKDYLWAYDEAVKAGAVAF
jgi:hypothetical protein